MFEKMNISIFWFEEFNLLNPRSTARHACIPTEENNVSMLTAKRRADKRAKGFGFRPNGNWQNLSTVHATREYIEQKDGSRRLLVVDAFPY